MALLDDLAGYMQAQGLGTVGTDIFKGGLTPAPVAQYALVESGGQVPLRELDNDLPVDQPTVQVLSRAESYNVASSRSWNAYYAFDTVLEQIISGTVYKVTEPQQPPFPVDWRRLNGEDRPIFVFNLQVEVQR